MTSRRVRDLSGLALTGPNAHLAHGGRLWGLSPDVKGVSFRVNWGFGPIVSSPGFPACSTVWECGAADRRRAVWYAAFGLYAAGVALFSGPGLDHWWGAWAAGGYALAAVIEVTVSVTVAWSGRLAIAASLAGALAAPTLWLMTREPTPAGCRGGGQGGGAAAASRHSLSADRGTVGRRLARLQPLPPGDGAVRPAGGARPARQDVALAHRRDVPAAVRDVPGHAHADGHG